MYFSDLDAVTDVYCQILIYEMAPTAPVLVLFAVASFFGNVAFSAMGFGTAICFLFVYQIGALAGMEECCDLPGVKTAVFLQTISLAVISPIMMWHVGLKENIRWELILLMIPSQLVSAPLGQFLQDYTPGALLKVIVGVLTIGVAINQLFNIYRATRESGYTTVKDTKKEPVYFMIGSQRSGSNWLQQLINERHPSIAVPHPPHILNSFFPILSQFGDLSSDSNFERLVNAVCDFVESSPVPWLDKSQSPIQLDRQIVNQQCQDKRTLMMLFEVSIPWEALQTFWRQVKVYLYL